MRKRARVTLAIMLAATAVATRGQQGQAQAQRPQPQQAPLAGTFEFQETVSTSPDGGNMRTATSRLTIKPQNDSVVVAYRQLIVGSFRARTDTLTGTATGKTITLNSTSHQVQLRLSNGDDISVNMYDQYVLTIKGDTIEGDITPVADNPSLQMMGRRIVGRRITPPAADAKGETTTND